MVHEYQNLRRVYLGIAIGLFIILVARLAYLQIFSWDTYYRESERNRVRDVVIEAPRGLLLDRNGEIMVDNRPAYSVSVIPYEFLESRSATSLLASILNESSVELVKAVRKEKIGNFSAVKVKRHIDFSVLSSIEEYRLDLPGVFYAVDSKRYYPAGIRAPHLFGYLSEITRDELSQVEDREYRMGDLIGKNGIEIIYEPYLRGQSGVKYIEVDVLGREVRELPELAGSSPQSGKNLYMTIDADVQRYLEKAMEGKRGAAVVLDPSNGEVLAIMSKPDYDPEIFSNPLTPEIWSALINNEEHPLYNRACQSLYPPGSIYKLVLAAAGLETGLIDLEETVTCYGSYRLGRRQFKCWKEKGHGEVNLLDAIQQSCNVYFYKKGLDVGLANWSKFSRFFRFGSKTGIDLPNEGSGLVPDAVYFDAKYGVKKWTRGLTLNLAVGQGELLTTPLQMAYFAMIVGNEGTAFRPHLVRKIEDPNTGESIEPGRERRQIVGISKSTYRTIKQGMYLVVNGPHGTGRASWVRGLNVCGKTGTAQNPHGNSHAWFIGFAPKDNPKIAFCVMVENGGGGGAVAAPIARGILTTYFRDNQLALGQ